MMLNSFDESSTAFLTKGIFLVMFAVRGEVYVCTPEN